MRTRIRNRTGTETTPPDPTVAAVDTPPEGPGSDGAEPDTRTGIATVGMLLFVAIMLVHVVAGALDGLTGDLGFFGAGLVISLVGVVVSRRQRRWAGIVTLVLTALLVLGYFWLLFGLGFPASPIEFSSGVAFLVGLVLAIWGAIRLIRRRPGRPRVQPTAVRGAVGLVALAVLVSGALAATTGRTVASADAEAADVVTTIAAFEFEEGTYEVAADQPTTLLVRNTDAFVHDFTVPDLDVAETLAPGEEVLVELTAPAGEYTIYCTLHSDGSVDDPEEAGMAAELVSR